MLLVFDVGNTNTVLGIYEHDQIIQNWRISTDRDKTFDEYGMLLANLFSYSNIQMSDITAIAISSVVPPVMPALEKMARKYFNVDPLVIGPGVKTGMPIKYDNPKEVGADRIVNSVGAYHQYGGPLVIVDFGTATTFCAISAKGEYLGGAIAPGIGVATEALFAKAAKLPRIELVKPKTAICKNTVTSMQAGIIFGFVGQVDGIVNRIKHELGQKAFVVATGGMAELIAKESETINKVDNHLTLEGLKLIYDKNRDSV